MRTLTRQLTENYSGTPEPMETARRFFDRDPPISGTFPTTMRNQQVEHHTVNPATETSTNIKIGRMFVALRLFDRVYSDIKLRKRHHRCLMNACTITDVKHAAGAGRPNTILTKQSTTSPQAHGVSTGPHLPLDIIFIYSNASSCGRIALFDTSTRGDSSPVLPPYSLEISY